MFKKFLIGPVPFSFALSFGFFVASLTSVEPTPVLQKTTPVTRQELVTEHEPVKDNFVPEFRELPNFEDKDYQLNLIDFYQRNGIYREGEVVAKSGEAWLTLFSRDGKYELTNSKAYVKKLNSVSYPGDEFDVLLRFVGPGDPVFAVRNIKGVNEGPVSTVYLRPSQDEIYQRNLPIGSMEEGYKRDFSLGDSWYILRVSRGITKDGTKVGVLVLEHENISQVIGQVYYVDGENIIVGRLLWAGDLDNDGKLDLYFDEYNEKGYFAVGLYLSTAADPGNFVKIVASFGMGGC